MLSILAPLLNAMNLTVHDKQRYRIHFSCNVAHNPSGQSTNSQFCGFEHKLDGEMQAFSVPISYRSVVIDFWHPQPMA